MEARREPYRVTVNLVGARVGDKVFIDPGNPNLEHLLVEPNPKLVPWIDPAPTKPSLELQEPVGEPDAPIVDFGPPEAPTPPEEPVEPLSPSGA